VLDYSLDVMADSILARWFAPGFAERHPAVYQGYLNMLRRTSQDGYLGMCAALRDADFTLRAPGILVPALVLTGADDISSPPASGRTLAAALTNARFEMIPESGHLSCIEQPEIVGLQIETFLGENGYGKREI
jgi:pimeloyl-ACP methyl ester carboxylesterase